MNPSRLLKGEKKKSKPQVAKPPGVVFNITGVCTAQCHGFVPCLKLQASRCHLSAFVLIFHFSDGGCHPSFFGIAFLYEVWPAHRL